MIKHDPDLMVAVCCLILAAIPGGLLWCINGLSRGDYSFSGGAWAGPTRLCRGLALHLLASFANQKFHATNKEQ